MDPPPQGKCKQQEVMGSRLMVDGWGGTEGLGPGFYLPPATVWHLEQSPNFD